MFNMSILENTLINDSTSDISKSLILRMESNLAQFAELICNFRDTDAITMCKTLDGMNINDTLSPKAVAELKPDLIYYAESSIVKKMLKAHMSLEDNLKKVAPMSISELI